MTTVAKAELKSLTALQKELHIPEHDDEEMASNFYSEFIRSTWYTNALIKFKINRSDSQADFVCPEPCGFLVYSEVKQDLPEISVKEEFKDIIRIAWTPSVAINSISRAKLTVGDVDSMGFNNISLDKYYQYFVRLDLIKS